MGVCSCGGSYEGANEPSVADGGNEKSEDTVLAGWRYERRRDLPVLAKDWKMLEGKCVKGERCEFPHLAADKLAMRVKRSICKHFTKGKCLNGRLCGYAHGEAELGTPDLSPLPDERAANSGKKMYLCKFFAAGRCNSGSNC